MSIQNPSFKLVECLKRYQAGDKGAGTEIFNSAQIQGIVGSECVKYIPTYELEETINICCEIVLTSLLTIKIDDKTNDGRIIAYFHKILPSRLYKAIKKLTDDRSFSLDEIIPDTDGLTVGDTIASSEPSALDLIIEQENINELRAAMKKLNPNQLRVVTMYYYEQMKLPEIAQELHISTQAAHQTLQRALAILRKELA